MRANDEADVRERDEHVLRKVRAAKGCQIVREELGHDLEAALGVRQEVAVRVAAVARDEHVVALPADVRDARRGGRLLQVQTGVAVELLRGHGRD